MDNTLTLLGQLDLTLVFGAISLVLLVGLGILIFLYVGKSEELQEVNESQDRLMRSFNELDEQAKLIVKTDLELNRAQEELDRRLDALNSLQIASREISKTLDQRQIFSQLNTALFNDLGFTKVLVVDSKRSQTSTQRINIGFEDLQIEEAISVIDQDEHIKTALSEGQTFSSLSSPQQIKAKIMENFKSDHFILTPIISQNEMLGFLFVGNRYNAPAVTEGDEEMIIILANQIGQALENAKLFEEVYRSRQQLESKVRDRTQQLQQAFHDVESLNKKKSEFISAVSHELRTPLTSIKGYASLLITGKIGIIPDAVKERLIKINTHSDNLVHLINNLLDIARIESGRVEIKLRRQNIMPLIENVGDLLTPQLKDKKIFFKNNVTTAIPDVYADSHQIERVFINLISNAIKFTPEEGTITVNAKENEQDKKLILSVTDTGIGISEEDQQKLFDEFFRVENEINMSVKGTGLGLALVRNIVEAHHGRVWVSSELNKGTTFHFELPTKEIAPKGDPA